MVDQRYTRRRSMDEWRLWIPMVVSTASTLLMLGVLYGKLSGRLDLIEYRIHRIEVVLKLEQ